MRLGDVLGRLAVRLLRGRAAGVWFTPNCHPVWVYSCDRFPLLPWVAGMTLGSYVIARRDSLSERLLRHEFVHVEQWWRYGWTFIPRYLWGWIRAGFSYEGNWMEREADAAE